MLSCPRVRWGREWRCCLHTGTHFHDSVARGRNRCHLPCAGALINVSFPFPCQLCRHLARARLFSHISQSRLAQTHGVALHMAMSHGAETEPEAAAALGSRRRLLLAGIASVFAPNAFVTPCFAEEDEDEDEEDPLPQPKLKVRRGLVSCVDRTYVEASGRRDVAILAHAHSKLNADMLPFRGRGRQRRRR